MLYSLDRFIKHALQIPLGQGRALKVLDRFDLLGHLYRLLILYRLHLALSQLLLHLRIIAQVELGPNKNNRHARRMVFYLRVPLNHNNQHSYPPSPIAKLTFAFTLSKLDGLTILKQIKNTSVCG